MEENDKLSALLRKRLAESQMDVREGFWEALQADLSAAEKGAAKAPGGAPKGRRNATLITPLRRRIAAAVAVVLVLGAASVGVWQFSPRQAIEDAFSQAGDHVPATDPTNADAERGMRVQPSTLQTADASTNPFPTTATPFPARQPRQTVNSSPNLLASLPTRQAEEAAEEEQEVKVSVSITITQRVDGNYSWSGNANSLSNRRNTYSYPWLFPLRNANRMDTTDNATNDDADNDSTPQDEQTRGWACLSQGWMWHVALGTALPKGKLHAPLTLELATERRLGAWLALSVGLQYHYLGTGDDATTGDRTADDLHILAIPVRVHARLASSNRVDLYAHAGGAVEKSVNKDFHDDPIRLAVSAGLGVSYRLGKQLALFAEPAVTHYFDTDSNVRSLRTERSTNLSLMCGLRMNY